MSFLKKIRLYWNISDLSFVLVQYRCLLISCSGELCSLTFKTITFEIIGIPTFFSSKFFLSTFTSWHHFCIRESTFYNYNIEYILRNLFFFFWEYIWVFQGTTCLFYKLFISSLWCLSVNKILQSILTYLPVIQSSCNFEHQRIPGDNTF